MSEPKFAEVGLEDIKRLLREYHDTRSIVIRDLKNVVQRAKALEPLIDSLVLTDIDFNRRRRAEIFAEIARLKSAMRRFEEKWP